jgi:hypothetical protein
VNRNGSLSARMNPAISGTNKVIPFEVVRLC